MLKPSNSPPSNGWIGSTTGACSSRSETSRPPRRKPPTMPSLSPSQWPRRTQTNLPPGNPVRFKDVGLNACLNLVKDRPDRQVALEVLERLFDRHQQQIMAPQLGGVFLDEVGAQQIPAFARSCLPQLIAIEPIAERGAVCGDLDRDQTPGGAGLIARGTEFHEQLLARERHCR